MCSAPCSTLTPSIRIGGASVGDHDRVKPAVRALGGELIVEGVAVRPGKPVWFAVLPDGRRAVVTDFDEGTVRWLTVGTGS